MSPAGSEAKLKMASPLIAQAVPIGDRRPYNVALVVLDPETVSERLSRVEQRLKRKPIAAKYAAEIEALYA